MKLFLALLQEITASVDGSSTISKVFIKNGGGPTSWSPSIGSGDDDEEEDNDDPAAAVVVVRVQSSSNFTSTPFIPLKDWIFVEIFSR